MAKRAEAAAGTPRKPTKAKYPAADSARIRTESATKEAAPISFSRGSDRPMKPTLAGRNDHDIFRIRPSAASPASQQTPEKIAAAGNRSQAGDDARVSIVARD